MINPWLVQVTMLRLGTCVTAGLALFYTCLLWLALDHQSVFLSAHHYNRDM